ncbi:hypothetical protein [Dyella solisilvae]|nr:hypothetical protein [Dyella solisilvae]
MSSLWTNLLFMHGHITDPELARRLANDPSPSSRPSGKRERATKAAEAARKAAPVPVAVPQGGCA